MKSYILFTVATFFALSVTSCKKDYTCACYSPSLNRSAPDIKINGTKKQAEDDCKALPQTGQYTGTDYVCNLK